MRLRFQPRYFYTCLLLVPILLLGAIIGRELDWGRKLHSKVPTSKVPVHKSTPVVLQPEFGLPQLDQTYGEMLARPLFVPTRRPPPPPPPPVPVVPPKPMMRKGQFVLLGVIITKDKKIALLREISNGKSVRVELGSEINGIKLEKLEHDKAIFKQWDDQEELILKVQAMPKPQPMPQPVVGGGVPLPAGTQPVPPPGAVPGQNSPVANDPTGIIARRRALRGL
ncbi:MAG: hypothetical protein V4805_02110 [Pseudomonadota bacterium]